MHKRFLPVTVLAVALLFNQADGFLIAALCPHLRAVAVSCHEREAPEAETSHHDMGEMATSDMEMMGSTHSADARVSNPVPNAVAFGSPAATCPHCAVHSRTTTNPVSLRQSEAARRSGDGIVGLEFSRIVRIVAAPFEAPASRAHGPPGANVARYVLMNTFRI